MKIVVNAISTKKGAGGAFQIAQNFIRATLMYPASNVIWYYIISEDVDEQFGNVFEDVKDKRYFVFPTQPDFRKTYKDVKNKLKELEIRINPDVIYTISSPCYFSFISKEVLRYTNPLVVTPNKYANSVLTTKQKLRNFAYNYIQKRLMKKAKYFITQTQIMKDGIMKITNLPDTNVKVVSNVLPTTFLK